VAGGASAAARLRRLDERAEIAMLEKGEYISFACPTTSAARTAESIEPSTSAGKTDAARDRATQTLRDPARAAELIKAVPIRLFRPRPIAEAISCAGGVRFGGLNQSLMLTELPGVFCAGEMLDWEAPTGGFMLHGCFATAARAAAGCAAWLERG